VGHIGYTMSITMEEEEEEEELLPYG